MPRLLAPFDAQDDSDGALRGHVANEGQAQMVRLQPVDQKRFPHLEARLRCDKDAQASLRLIENAAEEILAMAVNRQQLFFEWRRRPGMGPLFVHADFPSGGKMTVRRPRAAVSADVRQFRF